MTALVRDMPERERPISEEFRLVAKAWADAEHAAALLEDTKSATLAQMMVALGDLPVSKAEMIVKASKDWRDHLDIIAKARKEANLRKVQMEYVRLRFTEWQMGMATARDERKMGRAGP